MLALCVPVLAFVFPGFPSSAPFHDEDQVEIVYDDNLIPHVFGTSDEAALYGLGYHHVLEYPIGTLNMLWLSSGRMAEVAGGSYLDEDRRIRLWEVPRIAERHRGELADAGLLPLLEAYVRGVEAGRAFWRDGGTPETSARIDALFGPQGEIFVDPVPDYLNPLFSPFGPFNDPTLPQQMRAVVDRLFAEDMAVTLDHVLRLGVTVQSFFLYNPNAAPQTVLPPIGSAAPLVAQGSAEQETMRPLNDSGTPMSNGWMIPGGAALFGRPIVLSDSHVNFNRLHLRPYLVQVAGSSFQSTGLSLPGHPGMINGFSERIAWTVTASPPAVSQNAWTVQLESSENADELFFAVDAESGESTQSLEKVLDPIDVFDPRTGTVSTFVDTRYYVPQHSTESKDLGFDRYPVIPTSSNAPRPGDVIRFEQASFTAEGSFWEFTLGMGRAHDSHEARDVVERARPIFGDGNNLMIADRDSNLLYVLAARTPIQGDGVPEAEFRADALLDGGSLGQRWRGIHPFEEMPILGPVDLSHENEVWINNNVTPDRIVDGRFTEEDLADFPAYMVPRESVTTWRQERARDLLMRLPFKLPPLYSELVGRDMTDAWTKEMWPLFEQTDALVAGGLSANARLFVDWVNEYRDEDEWGGHNPHYDFVAHRFSRVTVYTVVLRSLYERALEGTTSTELQATLGTDPLHPALEDPYAFDPVAYAPNLAAMRAALENTTGLWLLGSGPNGLSNQAQLAGLSASIPGDPWADERFSTDRDPHWLGVLPGDKVTRWGHAHMIALTPHAPDIPGAADLGPSIPLFQGFLFAALQPAFLSALPFPFLRLPFYAAQTPRVLPIGGTDQSLFTTKHQQVLSGPPPNGFDQSIYRSSPQDFFNYHPHTSGSQTLFSVQLQPSGWWWPAPWTLFLQAVGGTEITKPDLFGDGLLAYQDRYANLEAFSRGWWGFLKTKRWFLGAPTHVLSYED